MGTGFIDAKSDLPLADGTRCVWGKTGLWRNADDEYSWKMPNCQRSNPACSVDRFFDDNRQMFEAILREIKALEPEFVTKQIQQFSDLIERALEDPKVLLDYGTGCKLFADAIIAVDSRNHRCMATQNYKESAFLTKVLGQTCLYLANNPEHGIQLVALHSPPEIAGGSSSTRT